MGSLTGQTGAWTDGQNQPRNKMELQTVLAILTIVVVWVGVAGVAGWGGWGGWLWWLAGVAGVRWLANGTTDWEPLPIDDLGALPVESDQGYSSTCVAHSLGKCLRKALHDKNFESDQEQIINGFKGITNDKGGYPSDCHNKNIMATGTTNGEPKTVKTVIKVEQFKNKKLSCWYPLIHFVQQVLRCKSQSFQLDPDFTYILGFYPNGSKKMGHAIYASGYNPNTGIFSTIDSYPKGDSRRKTEVHETRDNVRYVYRIDFPGLQNLNKMKMAGALPSTPRAYAPVSGPIAPVGTGSAQGQVPVLVPTEPEDWMEVFIRESVKPPLGNDFIVNLAYKMDSTWGMEIAQAYDTWRKEVIQMISTDPEAKARELLIRWTAQMGKGAATRGNFIITLRKMPLSTALIEKIEAAGC